MLRSRYQEAVLSLNGLSSFAKPALLMGKFPGEAVDSKFQIEIQLRTEIQHAWATALEIIDLFTRQKLKANDGNRHWQDFFRLAAEALSALDDGDVDQERHKETYLQVSRLAHDLHIIAKFKAFNNSLKVLEESGVKAVEGYYLLQINTRKPTIQYQFFPIEAYDLAVAHYLSTETTSMKKADLVVALVSTDSMRNLKEAYPNYFADSVNFVRYLETIIARAEYTNPNWLTRFFLNLNVIGGNAK